MCTYLSEGSRGFGRFQWLQSSGQVQVSWIPRGEHLFTDVKERMARLNSGTEIVKMHVSSAHRKSGSASDWRFEVPGGQELICDEDTMFSIADFTCNHAWYNVSHGNNKAYVRRRTTAGLPLTYDDLSVTVPIGNYTAQTLIQTIATQLSTSGRTLTGNFSSSTHTYSLTESGGHGFLLFSDLMLRSHEFNGVLQSTAASLNSILSTPDVDVTSITSFQVAWTSGLATNIRLNALELRSSQLGGHTLSVGGALDAIKRMPILTNFGEVLLDTSTVNERDWLPCPRVIRVLDFRICDDEGRTVETGGSVGFTLNFSRQ